MQPARGVPLEEEELIRDIEGGPFYSGGQLKSINICTSLHVFCWSNFCAAFDSTCR